GFPSLPDALGQVHHPASKAQEEDARRRLRYEEAYVLQVELARPRERAAALPAVPRLARPNGLLAAFAEPVPFALTDRPRAAGDAETADDRGDGVRRPRRLDTVGAGGGPLRRHDVRRARGPAAPCRPHLATRARGGRRRSPGVRRLPTYRGGRVRGAGRGRAR